ncbi:MAG: hypothetical protein K8S97_11865 [Anaerolineae bacterium]|nr:hypothetical protein [Anaerolineae bacterium]
MRKPKAKIRPQVVPVGDLRPDDDYFFLNPQYRDGVTAFPFEMLGEPDLGHWKWQGPLGIVLAIIAIALTVTFYCDS